MLKFALISLLSVAASTASAHFEIGTYAGVTDDGKACGLEILGVSFAGGMAHPLNERVQVRMDFLGGEVVTMQHLAQVDLVENKVRPKMGVLTAYRATKTGAEAVELIMQQDVGPSQVVAITDHYRDPSANQRKSCMNLKFVAK